MRLLEKNNRSTQKEDSSPFPNQKLIIVIVYVINIQIVLKQTILWSQSPKN